MKWIRVSKSSKSVDVYQEMLICRNIKNFSVHVKKELRGEQANLNKHLSLYFRKKKKIRKNWNFFRFAFGKKN